MYKLLRLCMMFVTAVTILILDTSCEKIDENAIFTVTFDTNGGSNITAQYVKYGSTAIAPTNLIRAGYTSVEWYSDSALTSAYNFDTPVIRDITLYAKWSLYNPTVDLQKSQLRVLDIGNSYTNDATHYLSSIVSASGVDVSDMYLYRAIRGGASFRNWCNIYNDLDNISYTISKVVGNLNSSVATGTGSAGDGELFRKLLADNEWDIVIIHQVSTYAPYYDRWEESGSAGGLSDLISIIKEHQPQTTIGFLLVHSYASNYESNTEKSSFDRWNLIAESAQKLNENYNIDFIIPYGTAVQNLRASSLNTYNSNTGYYNDFTSDGTHCADGLGDYVAACCYFQTLFAPRHVVSILGNTFNAINVTESGTTYQGTISVTPDNATVAQKAAILATENMYTCINPDIVTF